MPTKTKVTTQVPPKQSSKKANLSKALQANLKRRKAVRNKAEK